jgi:hypothetical protein
MVGPTDVGVPSLLDGAEYLRMSRVSNGASERPSASKSKSKSGSASVATRFDFDSDPDPDPDPDPDSDIDEHDSSV